MEKETKNAQPAETETLFESVSDLDDDRPSEFIEPLKEIDDSPEGEEEINLNPDMSDEMKIDTEVPDQESPDDAFPESEGLTEQESVEAPIEDSKDQHDEDAGETPQADETPETEPEDAADGPEDVSKESAESSEEATAEEPEGVLPEDPAAELENDDVEVDPDKEDASESSESAQVSDTQLPDDDEISDDEMELEADDISEGSEGPAAEENAEEDDASEADDEIQKEPIVAASGSLAGKRKNGNHTKLAFSAIILCGLIIGLLAYTDQFSFLNTDTNRPPEVTVTEPDQKETSLKKNAPQKIDPYAKYRSKLREAAELRESILIKQQEIQRLKLEYAEGIEKLENDILVEILDYNLNKYGPALENKRVELGLQTIQRRQAYIHKLDDPIEWLEQGSEELLYLKRRAAFDLQLIEVAGNINMNKHMRHINAAIQKYRLTADNLAIDPNTVEMEPARKIWQRLYLKTQNNPFLRAELNNWYIQKEVCSGNLSRIGELSKISPETARCMSELDAADLFLNNIKELSPSAVKYLCRWDGKWLCLNGVHTLSPSVAQYLFQWQGEWISLNGLSEFPPDRAKFLVQWEGKQLELMGLQDNIQHKDRQTLAYLAEWEKAGGKLFVPQHIRNLMDQL